MRTKVNEKTFDGQKFYVGIDVHKKSWKVTVLSDQYEHKTMSQDPDAKLLAGYLHRHFPGATYQAVYEAGFSGFSNCRELNDLGVNCIVIHPADVPTSQKERLLKTDKADSRKLAKSLRSDELKAIDIPDPKIEADRALVRQRFRVMKDLSRTKNRTKSFLFQFGVNIPGQYTQTQSRHWSKPYMSWLRNLPIGEDSSRRVLNNYLEIGQTQREQLLKINRQVRELSQTNEYKDDFQLLLSVPGIGLLTSMTILTQLSNIARFSRLDELCSYVGLIPRMHGSGDKMQTGKMVRRGRKELKIMLIEASWEAIRKDPALMAKFAELSKRMNKNKAIIRIARKLLSRIRYVLINREKYELSLVK
jgi:transposase